MVERVWQAVGFRSNRASAPHLGRCVAISLALHAASGAAGVVGAQVEAPLTPNIGVDPDARRHVGMFTDVSHVALTRRYVFSAATGGIAVFDRILGQWQPPLPLPRPNPRSVLPITALAADPVDDAVWFGMQGFVFSYRPATGQLTRTAVSGDVMLIAFDTSITSDAFVRTTPGWTRISRTGAVSAAQPQQLDERLVGKRAGLNHAFAKFPGLRAHLLTVAAKRNAQQPFSYFEVRDAAVSAEHASEVWIGTSNDGLWKMDARARTIWPLNFGLADRDAGPLVVAADGILIAPGSSARGLVMHVTDDLKHWASMETSGDVPWRGNHTYAMSVGGSFAWLGTDMGVVRVHLLHEAKPVAWTTKQGLPSDAVHFVAATTNGAWAGTTAGLVFINTRNDVRQVEVPVPTTRVRAGTLGETWPVSRSVTSLSVVRDTVWIGTRYGLFLAGPDDVRATQVLRDDVRFEGEVGVLSFTETDSTLLIAADNRIYLMPRRVTATAAETRPLAGAPVGPLHAVTMDARSIVTRTNDGIIVAPRFGRGVTTLLKQDVDFQGNVVSFVLSRDWFWLATTAGLTRIARQPDGSIR